MVKAQANGRLRLGMDQFLVDLKNSARTRKLRWNLVCCGSRVQAFNDFRNFEEHDGYDTPILLVDAEEPVRHNSSQEHLRERDGWDLSFCNNHSVHLMTQVMEAWIVADPIALKKYYGNEFRDSALS